MHKSHTIISIQPFHFATNHSTLCCHLPLAARPNGPGILCIGKGATPEAASEHDIDLFTTRRIWIKLPIRNLLFIYTHHMHTIWLQSVGLYRFLCQLSRTRYGKKLCACMCMVICLSSVKMRPPIIHIIRLRSIVASARQNDIYMHKRTLQAQIKEVERSGEKGARAQKKFARAAYGSIFALYWYGKRFHK